VLEGLEPVRKRPGMYIGGTDERALHHLVAEVLDNSMDEAVAGHANRIEVELHADHGRHHPRQRPRHPVDPHPKFPDKSALEVILCTLHAGGKFSGKAYQTSGGLHGVGVSVVNALSDHLRVEVARNRSFIAQEFSRGLPQGPAGRDRPGPQPARHHRDLPPRPRDLRRPPVQARAAVQDGRSKAYLFPGSKSAGNPRRRRWRHAGRGAFHFPGGLADYLTETWAAPRPMPTRPLPARSNSPNVRPARFGRMGDQLDARARRLHPVLLQHRAHARGRHP
jgi:topoisomerase-4 subunit B